jgi:adenosylcobinamide-phosphate synthase
MAFLSLLLAFLLEQAKPLAGTNPVHRGIAWLAAWAERNFNAGHERHGAFAWCLVVGVPLLALSLLSWLLARVHPMLALAIHVAILYFTMGFRHFSHFYTSIQLALSAGDLPAARRHLETWRRHNDPRFSAEHMSVEEVCRLAIVSALDAAHRSVFAVMFWYTLLPGPAGAVVYRMTEYLARRWTMPDALRGEAFGNFARKAFYWLDWPAARITAVGFAIVGNFEEAVYGWRQRAAQWAPQGEHDPAENRGILIESAAGALGVQLSPLDPADPAALEEPAPAPMPSTLQSAVGLVWRAVVLWMTLIFLLSLATWVA